MSAGRSYGILVRVYTPNVEDVPKRVSRALAHVHQILAVSEKFPELKRVAFLVPRDYDCGQTYQALLDRVVAEGLTNRIEVYTPPGYHSCEVLNQGLIEFSRDTSHAIIISGKAMSYLTTSSLAAIDAAFAKGAKVAGLAVDELRDIVLEGRVQNTLAAWDIGALFSVGAFDCKTDVEEIAPLIRLARKFGPCIAPIDVEQGTLDVHTDVAAQERHRQVMTTKLRCQQAECERLESNFAFIREAIR